jgi:hypothetical protein
MNVASRGTESAVMDVIGGGQWVVHSGGGASSAEVGAVTEAAVSRR